MKKFLIATAIYITGASAFADFPFIESLRSADGLKGESSFEVRGQQSGYRSEEQYCSDPAVACGHSGGKVVFQLRYRNDTLPWGVKLELLCGLAGVDWCRGCEPPYHNSFDWREAKVVEMTPVASWTWSAETEAYGYAASAGGRYDALEFVVRVTYPDGSVRWDNGGSNRGYYKVDVPQPQFDLSWTPYQIYASPFKLLPVKIVKK